MRKNPRTRFLPLAILPATMSGMFVPILASRHFPDAAIGALAGFLVGLSAVALFWMAKGKSGCASSSASE